MCLSYQAFYGLYLFFIDLLVCNAHDYDVYEWIKASAIEITDATKGPEEAYDPFLWAHELPSIIGDHFLRQVYKIFYCIG